MIKFVTLYGTTKLISFVDDVVVNKLMNQDGVITKWIYA